MITCEMCSQLAKKTVSRAERVALAIHLTECKDCLNREKANSPPKPTAEEILRASWMMIQDARVEDKEAQIPTNVLAMATLFVAEYTLKHGFERTTQVLKGEI